MQEVAHFQCSLRVKLQIPTGKKKNLGRLLSKSFAFSGTSPILLPWDSTDDAWLLPLCLLKFLLNKQDDGIILTLLYATIINFILTIIS